VTDLQHYENYEKVLFCTIKIERPEGKKPLGRPKRRWDINMSLRGMGWEVRDWVHLVKLLSFPS
jgi:hypothetical protein